MEIRQGTTLEATANGFGTGLAGTLRVRILDTPGETEVLAPRTGGIVEAPAGSGLYAVSIDDAIPPGTYSIVWDDQAGTWAKEDLTVLSAVDVVSGPSYTTLEAVRAEPDTPAGATDAALLSAIARAEDQIDEWLGPWPIQETTGRKIVTADVFAWQWQKLVTATTRLAARFAADPNILQGPRYATLSGPDFSKSNPAPTLRRIPDVIAPLRASGLRITGGRAHV